MDFGKASDLGKLDAFRFDLPPADPRSSLRGAPHSSPRIYLGAPVWSHAKWAGSIYPPKTKPGDYLHHYSRQFNSIELNSTFYRVPDQKTLHAWSEATPSDFRFSPKLNQGISHHAGSSEFLASFCREMEALGDRLGLSFLQLPPGLSRNLLPSLRRLLQLKPRHYPLAVEFRHPSWFVEGRLCDEAFELLSELGLSSVITDTTDRRDVLHTSLTSSRVMIRFLGNELHASDFARIARWVETIGEWLDAGLEEVYFFVHQAGYDGVVELAQSFALQLKKKTGIDVRSPKLLQEDQPSLF